MFKKIFLIENINQFIYSQPRFQSHIFLGKEKWSLFDVLRIYMNILFWLPCGMRYFSSVLLWPPGLHCPSRALQYFLPVLTLLSSVTAAAKSFIASTAGTDWLVSTKSQLDMSNTSLPCPLEPYVDQSEQSSLQRMWENLCLSPYRVFFFIEFIFDVIIMCIF